MQNDIFITTWHLLIPCWCLLYYFLTWWCCLRVELLGGVSGLRSHTYSSLHSRNTEMPRSFSSPPCFSLPHNRRMLLPRAAAACWLTAFLAKPRITAALRRDCVYRVWTQTLKFGQRYRWLRDLGAPLISLQFRNAVSDTQQRHCGIANGWLRMLTAIITAAWQVRCVIAQH